MNCCNRCKNDESSWANQDGQGTPADNKSRIVLLARQFRGKAAKLMTEFRRNFLCAIFIFQTCSDILDSLSSGEFGPAGRSATDGFRSRCATLFPHSVKFRPPQEQQSTVCMSPSYALELDCSGNLPYTAGGRAYERWPWDLTTSVLLNFDTD